MITKILLQLVFACAIVCITEREFALRKAAEIPNKNREVEALIESDGPDLVFVVSPGGFKFCKLKVVEGYIIFVFKKPKTKGDPYSREVEVELLELLTYVFTAVTEYCRRTNQNLQPCYQGLTYRA